MIPNAKLVEQHPETVRILEEFEFASTASLIGGLFTVPDLHSSTLRIQVLALLAALSCKGTKIPGENDLLSLIKSFDSEFPFHHLEDPPEDVFTSYIGSGNGGWIVFAGIFANGYFWLERLIYFLERKSEFPGFSNLLKSTFDLLKLSDAAAKRSGVERYSKGGSHRGEKLRVPNGEKLKTHKDSVSFSKSELEELAIDTENLAPFLLDPERRNDLSEKNFWNDSLDRYPLLASDSSIILLDASSICRAGVHHLLDHAGKLLGGWADTFFQVESAEFFVNSVLHRLEVNHIDCELPTPPEELPHFFPYAGQFDYGKPVLGIVFSANLTDGADFDSIVALNNEQQELFESYLSMCCERLESVDGFSGGLILNGFSSIGRDLAFGLKAVPKKWHYFGAGLCEWQTLCTDSEFDAFRIWRLAEQIERAKTLNVEISNFTGFFNLYAYWKHSEFLLIPRECDIKHSANRIGLTLDFSQDLNVELKRRVDCHCRLDHTGEHWTNLQRINSGHVPDFNLNRVYGDIISARRESFLGCSERTKTIWWVEYLNFPSSDFAFDLVRQLWDCVLNWADFSAEIFQALVPEGTPSVLIRLECPGADSWKIENLESPQTECRESPAVTVNSGDRTITLSITEGFLQTFRRPSNDGERAIVDALLSAVAELGKKTLSEEKRAEYLGQIIPNEDARFFHVLRIKKLEDLLSSPGESDVRHVPKEDQNNVQIGLADRVGRLEPKQLSDKKHVTKFLTDTVTDIWEGIEEKLRKYDIGSVAYFSFQQMDEIGHERSRWDSTSRALLALHNHEPWIVDRISEARSDLIIAEIANRLTVEIAMYAGSTESGPQISLVEHSLILAEIAAMLQLANHRDAIAGGFMNPRLVIHPNGSIEFDLEFYDRVFSPYMNTNVRDQIQISADRYEEYFEEEPDPKESKEAPLDAQGKAFVSAFRAEFGFKFDALGDVLEFFHDYAMKNKKPLVVIPSQELRKQLMAVSQISSQQANAFLERFVLPIRRAWNKDLGRFKQEDVFPWRYWRGFSLLSRPFVHVSNGPRMLMVSVPHLHRWFQYFSSSLIEGKFPDRHFRSQEMKSYFGQIANSRGHAFEKRVYDALTSDGFDCELNVSLTSLGAPKNPDLGDFDVFAWEAGSKRVFLIECKRLRAAISPRDVIQQLEDFKGKEGDRLGKHLRRVEWIKENPEEVEKKTGISTDEIEWVPLLVTSNRVPMSFVDAIQFPAKWVIPFRELSKLKT